jgi:hypothetical protein
MKPLLLVACCLTNLSDVPPAPGLPSGWDLRGVRGAPRPAFEVVDGGMLRVEGTGAAGFATYELADAIDPEPGALRWRWRADAPVENADLRDRHRDDSPIRLLVVFRDRRMLFYTWGNAERAGEWFPSWTGDDRIVWVVRAADDADGAWRQDARDPFLDYRTAFDRDPVAIVAVGVVQDTDQLKAAARAEIGRIEWTPARERP